MLTIRHEFIKVEGKYRCIVISDVHSHLDRLKLLLKKVNYTNDDYLIILGDFIEKGTQALQTVDYLKALKSNNNRVYLILGNCEYALQEMLSNPKYSKHVIDYLNKIGKSGMITQAMKQLAITKEDNDFQNKIYLYLKHYFDFFDTLPTTLQFNNFLFVHAGIENRTDWKNSSRSSFIEKRDFLKQGHMFNGYVVVGHLPTSNYYQNRIDNDIIIDEDKKIICIDGGTGVKSISQLNALIIEGNNNDFKLKSDSIIELPNYQVKVEIHCESKQINKIAWPNFNIEIIRAGKEFSLCKQINTGNVLMIKNEFIYTKDNQLYCLDDYIDNMLSLDFGDIVKLIGIYGPYAYVIKDNNIGWVKYRYLQKL